MIDVTRNHQLIWSPMYMMILIIITQLLLIHLSGAPESNWFLFVGNEGHSYIPAPQFLQNQHYYVDLVASVGFEPTISWLWPTQYYPHRTKQDSISPILLFTYTFLCVYICSKCWIWTGDLLVMSQAGFHFPNLLLLGMIFFIIYKDFHTFWRKNMRFELMEAINPSRFLNERFRPLSQFS